ncbi:MAG: hypothetical protein AB1540_00065 [Bdellovibrionota bacterium]
MKKVEANDPEAHLKTALAARETKETQGVRGTKAFVEDIVKARKAQGELRTRQEEDSARAELEFTALTDHGFLQKVILRVLAAKKISDASAIRATLEATPGRLKENDFSLIHDIVNTLVREIDPDLDYNERSEIPELAKEFGYKDTVEGRREYREFVTLWRTHQRQNFRLVGILVTDLLVEVSKPFIDQVIALRGGALKRLLVRVEPAELLERKQLVNLGNVKLGKEEAYNSKELFDYLDSSHEAFVNYFVVTNLQYLTPTQLVSLLKRHGKVLTKEAREEAEAHVYDSLIQKLENSMAGAYHPGEAGEAMASLKDFFGVATKYNYEGFVPTYGSRLRLEELDGLIGLEAFGRLPADVQEKVQYQRLVAFYEHVIERVKGQGKRAFSRDALLKLFDQRANEIDQRKGAVNNPLLQMQLELMAAFLNSEHGHHRPAENPNYSACKNCEVEGATYELSILKKMSEMAQRSYEALRAGVDLSPPAPEGVLRAFDLAIQRNEAILEKVEASPKKTFPNTNPRAGGSGGEIYVLGAYAQNIIEATKIQEGLTSPYQKDLIEFFVLISRAEMHRYESGYSSITKEGAIRLLKKANFILVDMQTILSGRTLPGAPIE